MSDINLLPKLEMPAKKNQYTSRLMRTIALAASLLIISGVGVGAMRLLEASYAASRSGLMKEMKTYSAINSTKESIRKHEDRINTMTSVMESVRKNEDVKTDILSAISKAMPQNVFLTSFSASSSNNITLKCISKDQEGISYFIYNLRKTGLFGDVQISDIIENSNGKSGFRFTAAIKSRK